jgi:hypothetical protein
MKKVTASNAVFVTTTFSLSHNSILLRSNMSLFVSLKEIYPGDKGKILKLKKKYNRSASILNAHCEGKHLSNDKKMSALKDLILAGKEINDYESRLIEHENGLNKSFVNDLNKSK